MRTFSEAVGLVLSGYHSSRRYAVARCVAIGFAIVIRASGWGSGGSLGLSEAFREARYYIRGGKREFSGTDKATFGRAKFIAEWISLRKNADIRAMLFQSSSVSDAVGTLLMALDNLYGGEVRSVADLDTVINQLNSKIGIPLPS